jgi:hypothetical protein
VLSSMPLREVVPVKRRAVRGASAPACVRGECH